MPLTLLDSALVIHVGEASTTTSKQRLKPRALSLRRYTILNPFLSIKYRLQASKFDLTNYKVPRQTRKNPISSQSPVPRAPPSRGSPCLRIRLSPAYLVATRNGFRESHQETKPAKKSYLAILHLSPGIQSSRALEACHVRSRLQ